MISSFGTSGQHLLVAKLRRPPLHPKGFVGVENGPGGGRCTRCFHDKGLPELHFSLMATGAAGRGDHLLAVGEQTHRNDIIHSHFNGGGGGVRIMPAFANNLSPEQPQ